MSSKMVDWMIACMLGVLIVPITICVCYVPGLMSSKISLNRAAAKALSGLDLRDEDVRQTLRGLFGVEKDTKE